MRSTRYIILLLLVGLLSCSRQDLNYPDRQMPDDIRQDRDGLEKAATIFARKCAYCHGLPGEGRGERADFFQPPAPDFFQEKYRTADPAYLYWRIAKGKTVEPFLSRGSVMPAWGPHFTEREIWLLVEFIRRRPDSR